MQTVTCNLKYIYYHNNPHIQYTSTAADLKACYDKYDEEGLKGGVPTSNGTFLEGYVFHGNSEQIFREFFGGNNPFAGMLC